MKNMGGNVAYYFSYHVRQCKNVYFSILICAVCGVVLGVVLHFTTSFGSFLLNDNDQLIFDFVSRDVSVITFIASKVRNLFVAFLIIFVFALWFYSSFVCFAFFAYQGMLLSACCCQIIASYGVLGAVNVFVVLLPVNLTLFAVLAYFCCVCLQRTFMARRYKMSLKNSFLYKQYMGREVAFSVVCGLVAIVAFSVVYSVLLRNVGFVVF